MLDTERRRLGETSIELPPIGLRASKPFDVTGKESQAARATLVQTAIADGADFFASSLAHGEAARILAAGLIGARYRSTVMMTVHSEDTAAAYRELDVALHLFDGHVELLVAQWEAASNALLTSLARMRAVGETSAIGVACSSADALEEAGRRIVSDSLDIIVLPATLLISERVHQLIDDVVSKRCGLICYLPDGLETLRGDALANMKINPRQHALESVGDVLFKFAMSDTRLTSVVAPARRPRDLAKLQEIASRPPFEVMEMDALRTD